MPWSMLTSTRALIWGKIKYLSNMKSVTCDYMNNLNNRKLSFTDLTVLEVTILEVVWMFYLLIQMIEGKLHIWSIIFTIPMYITFKKLQVKKQCKITSFYCYLGVVMFEKKSGYILVMYIIPCWEQKTLALWSRGKMQSNCQRRNQFLIFIICYIILI